MAVGVACSNMPVSVACLTEWQVIYKNAAAGDNIVDRMHRAKWESKLKAIELAMKHLGILEEKVSVSGDWDKLAQRLASVRQGR